MSALIARSRERSKALIDAARNQCTTVYAGFHTTWQDEVVSPKLALYAGLVLVTIMWLTVTLLLRLRTERRKATTRPSTPNLDKRSSFKPADRTPGGTLNIPAPSFNFFQVLC